ncbi:MAG: hypothetical protein ACYTG0_24080 [Planctomycetota bacterium]|jgi:hypothetical protein
MIAPLPPTDPKTTETEWTLRRARRLVVSTLLKRRPAWGGDGPPVSAGRAWLFAGWVAIVATVYFAAMLGFL